MNTDNLLERTIVILDCQTTGMHPNTGRILQIGWALYNPQDLDLISIEKRTIKLPPEVELPNKIKKMLHLSEDDLAQSKEPKEVYDELQSLLNNLEDSPIVLAHYAQFEQSFLKSFYFEHIQSDELNFQLLCSQKIAKRLLPNLPSHNLKALAGFYQLANTRKNEVSSHVKMTYHVWQQLIPLLMQENITTYSALSTWLNSKISPTAPPHYQYNIERLTRLELPETPGVYHMLDKEGAILYVGKATSLKARVNSYFRGVKNRDRRKLEMLTQVWNIHTFECETPLEAALLESDDIKKWDPPYNLLLKENNRRIIFYNKEFSHYSEHQDAVFFKGPFKPADSLNHLMELIKAIQNRSKLPYEEEIHSDIIERAWTLFCKSHQLDVGLLNETNWRVFFYVGYKLLGQFEQHHGRGNFEQWWLTKKKTQDLEELSLEQLIAEKISRYFIRAGEELRKNIALRQLMNCTLLIRSSQKKLRLLKGELIKGASMNSSNTGSFTLTHYDRLCILLSAKKKKLLTLL
ncbi:exonuclease domain-containing protein [Legionella sp. km772]|uniref:exonuclease domain-containing protein n=1 Tax=Legionella sp. km772 TaxID=2498111 RepID=UPI000F8C8EEF|nr:exonuclease domain-containing protein [Legionella sp. km772]RUR08310.1 excinuclease ABC subunit C [Legionella sp. km772]